MSRRVIERARAGDRAKAAERAPAVETVDYKLEFQRVSAANAHLQLTVADLQLQLAKINRASPKALERAQGKLKAAAALSEQADLSLARGLAGAIAAEPKTKRKTTSKSGGPATKRKAVRRG